MYILLLLNFFQLLIESEGHVKQNDLVTSCDQLAS